MSIRSVILYYLNNIIPAPTENKERFLSALQNEMPSETCMDLAAWYWRLGCTDEIKSLLSITPDGAEAKIWKKVFLYPLHSRRTGNKYLYAAFPFRPETAEILEKQLQTDNCLAVEICAGSDLRGREKY